jgi:putative salt-induced outer membrane protein YdiY
MYILLMLFLLPAQAFADELILENGDRLSGTVTGMTEGFLTISTQYSEPIQIQKAKVKRIFMRNDALVQMSNGEVLKGKIDTEESGKLYIQSSDSRGNTAIEWDKVASINPPPVAGPAWKGSITLGGNSQTGNTSRSSLSIGADATRRSLNDRISLRVLYNYARENKVMSTRNVYGALKYDYFFTKIFYGYVGMELLNDKFKDLSLRTIAGPGVGYQIWEDSVKALSVEAGLTYVSDNYKVAEDNNYLSARLAGNFSYKLWDNVVFGDQLILYPNLDHLGRYKLRNEAAITSALGAG